MIEVKGYLVQYSWDEKLELVSRVQEDAHVLTHREIEIEVPLASLRFNPTDTAARDKILALNTVRAKEKEIADNVVKNEKLKQEIQELLALEVSHEA